MALAAPFPAAASTSARRTTRTATVRASTPRATTARTRRPAARPGLRLTRRGRLAIGAVSVLFLLAVMVLSGRVSADAGTSIRDQGRATGVVVVQPGENLWQIATAIAPDTDPRETVAVLRELNGLETSAVVAGQSIVVPVRAAA
jgi:hypothetical protein